MLIAFQVILLFLIIGTGIGVANEEDFKLQANMALLTAIYVIAFIVGVMYL